LGFKRKKGFLSSSRNTSDYSDQNCTKRGEKLPINLEGTGLDLNPKLSVAGYVHRKRGGKGEDLDKGAKVAAS